MWCTFCAQAKVPPCAPTLWARNENIAPLNLNMHGTDGCMVPSLFFGLAWLALQCIATAHCDAAHLPCENTHQVSAALKLLMQQGRSRLNTLHRARPLAVIGKSFG